MRLGQQVKKLRKSLKLTQKQFASRVPGKIDYTYIGKIEREQQYPSLKLVERTARAYGVPVLYFFLEDGGAEAGEFDRYLGVSLKVKESIRRWMAKKLPAFEEELAQEIEKAIEGALREARGKKKRPRLSEDEENSQENDLFPERGIAEQILPAPLPFCDYPIIAGRMQS